MLDESKKLSKDYSLEKLNDPGGENTQRLEVSNDSYGYVELSWRASETYKRWMTTDPSLPNQERFFGLSTMPKLPGPGESPYYPDKFCEQ